MQTRRVFTRLMFSYLAIILLVVGVVSVVFINLMQRYFFSIEGLQLALQGDKASALLQEKLFEQDLDALDALTKTLSFSYDSHIWVTNGEGAVLSYAGNDLEKLGLGVEAAEIANVLAGNIITKQITGPGYNSLFYMAPLYEPGFEPEDGWVIVDAAKEDSRVIGALAISSPLGPWSSTIARITRLGLYAALGVVSLAVAIGYTLSRRISSPLEEMSKVAWELSRGNYGIRVHHRSSDELGRLAETLNFAIEKVSTAMVEQRRTLKMQKNLLSDVSHELRAPLTTLQGFLELMRGGKICPEEYPRYLEIMHRDAMHIGSLVDDLLDLDNLENYHTILEKGNWDPGSLLRSSAEHLQLKAAEKDISLQVEVDDDLTPLFVDQKRFHQVVVNLLENAIRFSPPGTAIRIKASAHSSGLLFEVADQGPGIPEEQLPLIWNRFYKVDKARTRQNSGSGLGLSIVKSIVELHGGWVSAGNNPGGGSTFSFWLP